jgi:hypothetical protein
MDTAWLSPEALDDLDKLARALLNGLTKIVFEDDSQVTVLSVGKTYAKDGEGPGVMAGEAVLIIQAKSSKPLSTEGTPLDGS